MAQFRVLTFDWSIAPVSISPILLLAGIIASAVSARAESNIDENNAHAWASNIGWLHFRPDSQNGVIVDEYVCSGWAYSANIGWIHFGNGAPADGIHYRNDSATDFGVNMNTHGSLRGMAYGANVGWINFESTGNPKVDLESGRLSGFAYGANVGWINLGKFNASVSIDSLAPGRDDDADGIPDPWELTRSGDLNRLEAGADADGDGALDFDEYLADTDPLDSSDNQAIVGLDAVENALLLTWTVRPTRFYTIQTRTSFEDTEIWNDLEAKLPGSDAGISSILFTNVSLLNQSYFRVKASRPLDP